MIGLGRLSVRDSKQLLRSVREMDGISSSGSSYSAGMGRRSAFICDMSRKVARQRHD
jgi:hypothetical protein